MFLYDVHVHTAESSSCSPQPAKEMAEAYKAKGYTGIVITDHFLTGSSTVPRDLPWKERIRLFCLGYDHAKERGDELGLDVFFGWEASFSGNDFLTYGLDRKWLEDHPGLLSLDVNAYLKFVRAEGGCVVHAHPFRQASYIPFIRLLPDLVDGVEIRNHSRPDKENMRNRWYAESYNLSPAAGSDSHQVKSIPERVIGSEVRFNGIQDYIAALRNRQLTIF